MDNEYIFPQKIYLDDEKTIEEIKRVFEVNNVANLNLSVGEWFSINNLKLRNEIGENVTINDLCDSKELLKNNNHKSKIEYIVKPLDTFSLVAKKINIAENYLRSIINTKHLYVGQKIVIGDD
ncbi:MAG: LysM peptidoglycan-binding domain-containing protein [Eubacteriales bacterium]|nr:LysM peptidoglycan-binding domain-containing protein [Eubacteriales bacterium]